MRTLHIYIYIYINQEADCIQRHRDGFVFLKLYTLSGEREGEMLSGRIAIVTGASRGIGRAVADKLASHGASVAMVDVEEIQEKNERNMISYRRDVTLESSGLIEEVARDMGDSPSILVNCAGITRDAFLWKMSEKNYDDVMNVNMKAPFFLTRDFAKRLMEHQKNIDREELGSIVNISSIIGKVGNMGQTNYAASKGGLISFTKSCAQDLARSRIRVNAILPGFIETPMAAAVPSKIIESMKQKIPMGYLGVPDDIAESVLFLASPKSKYITGACLEVTGGLYM